MQTLDEIMVLYYLCRLLYQQEQSTAKLSQIRKHKNCQKAINLCNIFS